MSDVGPKSEVAATAPARPVVSVVVPVKDNQGGIDALVRALEAQTDAAFELVIVDDGSRTPIRAPRGALGSVRILRLSQNIGPGAARNAGARAAHGDLLAFTDSDCRPNPRWIETWRRLHAGGLTAMAGSFERSKEGTIVALLRSDESAFYHKQSEEPVNCFTTANFAIDAKLFGAAGGFLEIRVGEDFLLGYRLFMLGHDVFWCPTNTVLQDNRARLGPYLRQQFAWAKAVFVFRALIPLVGRMKWNVRQGGLKAQLLLTGIFLAGLPLVPFAPRVAYISIASAAGAAALNGPFLLRAMRDRGPTVALRFLVLVLALRNPCWVAALARLVVSPKFWRSLLSARHLARSAATDPAKRLDLAKKGIALASGLGLISGYRSSAS